MSVNDKMTAIADGIRALLGTTAKMGVDAMATNLSTAKTNITSAYTAVSNKGGTVPSSKTSGNLASAILTIPTGSGGTTPTTVEQATPEISVSSAGLITASATQTAGYVAAGTKSATKQLTTQAAQTITPGTADKTITAGKYLTGTQTIKGDANLKAANIKSGVSIFDVLGTYEAEEPELQEKSVSPTTASQTITPDSGYDGLSRVTVGAMPTAAQATPSISVSGEGLITASATQSAGYVSAGTKSATTQLDTQEAKTVTPGTSDQTAVASGRYTTGAVTVRGDANLLAANIRSGVSIFDVLGTFEGEGGGLPDGLSALASGTFTPASVTTNSFTAHHNLGVIPNFGIVAFCDDNATLTIGRLMFCWVAEYSFLMNAGAQYIHRCFYRSSDGGVSYNNAAYDQSKRNETEMTFDFSTPDVGKTYFWLVGVIDGTV